MKRIFTGFLAIMLLAGAAQAQGNEKSKRHEKMQAMHEKQMAEGMKELNLTADQKAKLKTLHEQEKAEADALRNQKLTIEEHKAKQKELHEKYREQMKAILTPEQRQKMEAMHTNRGKTDEMRANHGHEGEMRPNARKEGAARDTIRAHGQYDRDMRGKQAKKAKDIADELDLTAEQKAKVKNIRQDYKGKLDAVKNDNSLTQEQKRAKFQELQKAQMDEMKSVLTKEQLEKMNTIRKREGKKK